MSTTLDRLVSGEYFPNYDGEEPEEYHAKVNQHVAMLKRKGATHVMINNAVCSIMWAMDPENSYLRFTTYGHSPDKFVTSSYNVGIYHEGLLAANRRLLLHNARLAKKHGLRCAIRCTEPTFMPESFFRRHPSLRGPRVDNPACSTTPLFGLCPMLPEVQDHYRQLITNLLTLVPEIDEMHIFTNDSGAGVCYSSHLYSGPNGPQHCQKTPPGKQAQVFAKVIAEAGLAINPKFRVVMTSGLAPNEKEDFLKGAPAGVASSVYGVFAWGGGLEDRWGTQAIGPKIYDDAKERERVRTWQFEDYKTRVSQVKDSGGIVYASYGSDYYTGDDPRPFETHEIICHLLSFGVQNIIGGGPGWTEYSANTAIIRHAMENGPMPTKQAVMELAQKWVGAELAPRLCEAWKLTDLAAREQPVPNGGHALAIQPLIVHMPIVPDEAQLGARDLDYFLTPVLRDQQKMKSHQGGVWRILNFGVENKLAYLKQYERAVFVRYEKALGIFNDLLAVTGLTAPQKACVEEQRKIIASYLRTYRHLVNWMLASMHRIKGESAPKGAPSLPEIIGNEIELYAEDARENGHAPAIRARLALMREHLNDQAVRVDLSEFPLNQHIGLEGFEPAHKP